jgi:uncharacterized linocin/CFP29 family protein
MNGTLGRDRVWNDHIWSEIDKAVREEVGRVRVAQKVFPSTVVNNVLPVSTTRVVPFGPPPAPPAPPVPLVPADDQFQPFFEISRQFQLSQAQVDGEENLHLASSRARMAASAIANAEDTILFLGPGSIPALIPPPPIGGVNVTNLPAIPPGFVAETANYGPPFTAVPGAAPGVLGNILAAVANGMAALNLRDQPGPYALFLSPVRYGQTFAPLLGLLQGPGDQINRIATGGFNMVNSLAVANLVALPPASLAAFSGLPAWLAYLLLFFNILPFNPDIGILVSLGGEPVKIVLGTDAVTAFTHTDPQGNYHFRVFERIQMVVQDGRAFQRLTF